MKRDAMKCIAVKKNEYCGEQRGLSKSVLEFFIGLGLQLGDFGQSSGKQGFPLGGMLSGNGGGPMIGYFTKSYPEGGKNELRLRLQLVTQQQSLLLARDICHFCGLVIVLGFFSEFSQDCGVVCFCLDLSQTQSYFF